MGERVLKRSPRTRQRPRARRSSSADAARLRPCITPDDSNRRRSRKFVSVSIRGKPWKLFASIRQCQHLSRAHTNCNKGQRADQWHLKNRAASSARPRGSRPARVGKSVAATSERDAAADAPAEDEADRQRERHDDARVPARAHEACFHSLSSGKIFVRTPKRLGHRLGGGR